VLIVDDDEDDLVALEATLGPLSLEVVKAGSGEEALMRILDRDFAAVILDLMMPRLNGFEAAALIRERDRCRDLPILILSGFDEDGARSLRGYPPPEVEYLRKPVEPELLRRRVAECAARYAARMRRGGDDGPGR
jgi:CheY-like chemotaxis protein